MQAIALLIVAVFVIVPLAWHTGARRKWRALALQGALLAAAASFGIPGSSGPGFFVDTWLALAAVGSFYAGWRYGLAALALGGVYALAMESWLWPRFAYTASWVPVWVGAGCAISCAGWTVYGVHRAGLDSG